MKTPTLYLLSLFLAPLLDAVPDLSIANKIGYAYYGTPTIDGVISEDEWQESAKHSPYGVNLFIQSSTHYTPPTDENDLSGEWLALWDEDALYLLLTVKDDSIQDVIDSFELFVSTAYTRDFGARAEPGLDLASDFHAYVLVDSNFEGTAAHGFFSFGSETSIDDAMPYKITPPEDGYFAEVAIPWAFVMGDTVWSEVTFDNGTFYGGRNSDAYGYERDFIGFDIHLRDFDEGNVRTESKVAWNDGYEGLRGDFHWADTQVWGTLVLVQPPPVLCQADDTLFNSQHWVNMGEGFVFHHQYGWHYVAYCPFAYSFTEETWWYVHEAGDTADAFYIYDFASQKWRYILNGTVLDI